MLYPAQKRPLGKNSKHIILAAFLTLANITAKEANGFSTVVQSRTIIVDDDVRT